MTTRRKPEPQPVAKFAPPAAIAENATGEVARLQAVVDRLEADTAKTKQRLEELETSRASVVLNGGDLDALHAGLRDAEQLIKTLEAGQAPARAMLQNARAAEGKAALERRVAACTAEHGDAYAEKMVTACKLLADFVCVAAELDSHRQAIDWQNQEARQHGRDDLVVSLPALRRAVIDTIAPVDDSVLVPVRTGETDAVFEARLLAAASDAARPRGKTESRLSVLALAVGRAMHVERHDGEDRRAYGARRWEAVAAAMRSPRADGETEAEHRDRLRSALARLLHVERKGETDAAWQLRRNNAEATAVSRREFSDPLRKIGEQALVAIKRQVLGLDNLGLHRQHPEVHRLNPVRDADPDGDPATGRGVRLRRR